MVARKPGRAEGGNVLKGSMKDGAHLVLLLAAFLVGVAIFLVVRQSVVPEGFGRYGHYRAGSLNDIRSKPVSYAGRSVCAGCHYDADELLTSGKHAKISCETCHGPQAAHASDPASGVPKRPRIEGLCQRCHEADAARPKHFPQVASVTHSGGAACNSCHKPHKPNLAEIATERSRKQ